MSISKEMEKCIEAHAKLAGGIGVMSGPFAHADIPAMIGIWTDMFVELALLSDRELDKEMAKRIGVTVIFSAGVAQGAVKTVTTVGGWLLSIPTLGLSLVFASVANGGLNYTTTRVAGREGAELLIADKLTPENLMYATLSALGLRFKGWGSGRSQPPNPSDFDIC